MNFLPKLEPHLLSDDVHVQRFVLRILNDIHMFIPEEWIERLLADAMKSEEKETNILLSVDKYPLNDGAVKLLIQGMELADKSRLHLYRRFIDHIEPEMAMKHQEELEPYIQKSDWVFYQFLHEGTEEEIWGEYYSTLEKLETAKNFNQILYTRAKHLAKTLVKKGWVDENDIGLMLQKQLNERYFGFDGILSIYMIRLLKLTNFIPVLVSLLDRDEDILLEEVADVLISFQSDEVVELVQPYARLEESSVFAIAILSGTKTALAVKVLKELMNEINEDDQGLVFEALCHQVSKEAISEIKEFMKDEPESYMIEIEETVYGFYKVIGENHPDLTKWKKVAMERDIAFNEEMNYSSTPIRVEQKVGRNDPCPCGSGKKYKKCCGA